MRKSVLCSLGVALATSSPFVAKAEMADKPSVNLKYQYKDPGSGEIKSGKTVISFGDGDVTDPVLRRSFLAIKAGRIIQNFLSDWENGEESPRVIVNPKAKPMAVVDSDALPNPVAPKPDDQRPEESKRATHFAKAMRDWANKIDDEFSALNKDRGDAVCKSKFGMLKTRLEKLAVAFEKSPDFHQMRRGIPMGPGGMHRAPNIAAGAGGTRGAAPGGARAFGGAPESVKKGNFLTSGGVMDDNKFWEEVSQGRVPALSEFPMEGFLKYFRLWPDKEFTVPKDAESLTVLALGNGMYSPQKGDLLLQVTQAPNGTEENYKRPALNLVFAVDVSGSMGSTDAQRKNREWKRRERRSVRLWTNCDRTTR